jgi:hypothetical protein
VGGEMGNGLKMMEFLGGAFQDFGFFLPSEIIDILG